MALIPDSRSISKPPVYRTIGVQLLATAVAGLVALFWAGPLAAKSAMLGGMVATVPNAYFAWRAFLYTGTRSAAKAVGGFFQAEIGKFLFTAILFAAVFKLAQPIQPLVLFGVFVAVLLFGTVASVKLLKPANK